jgi:hypothetical protein
MRAARAIVMIPICFTVILQCPQASQVPHVKERLPYLKVSSGSRADEGVPKGVSERLTTPEHT